MMLLLLYLNAIAAASTTTVWLMWAAKWLTRKQPFLALLYAAGGFGAGMVAVGMIAVLIDGDATQSAVIARQWVWLALGAPALARLLELNRDNARSAFANHILTRVEARADAHDRRREPPA